MNSIRTACLMSALSIVLGGAAVAQDRMPPIPVDKMTDAQKAAANKLIGSQRGALIGPFIALVRSPGLMTQLQGLGDYIHYNETLGPKLTEFAILLTVHQWNQELEWNAHLSVGLKAGLEPEVMAAVHEGRRPMGMSSDEEMIYDFFTELQHDQGVSDPTYARAVKRFGESGVLDLIGTIGYYTTQSMVLNVARTPAGRRQVPAPAAPR